MIRVRAGVGYALAEGDGRGPLRPARRRAGRRRRRRCSRCRSALVDEALALELAAGGVVRDRGRRATRCVFLASLHAAERADRRAPRSARRRRAAVAGDRRRQGAGLGRQRSTGIALRRRAARRRARWRCDRSCWCSPAGPASARPRVLNAILQILTAKRVRPLLCAPTGRAAKRLAEVDRPRGADDPSPARSEPARRPLPPRRAHAARRRSASSSTRRRWSTCR